MRNLDIAVMAGDGIGPEVMAPTLEMLSWLSEEADEYTLNFSLLAAGADCYVETGEALPVATVDSARAADAILLGAMGMPGVRYPDGTEITPQIDLRMILSLYAGVRPVRIPRGHPTPLGNLAAHPVDFVLIRESTEGLFHTQGKGIVHDNVARETLQITRETSEKLFRFAFDLARNRKDAGIGPGRVTCVDKANVFRAFAFFRGIFDEEAARHPGLKADHIYVDAMALKMVEQPWNFDVLVTENMFGDILSDLGAGIMGGLGMAPSADIGDDHAVFQPCHGTAPDIAGQGLANPCAMILSGGLMLEWLGHRHGIKAMVSDAARLQNAVERVINMGAPRTHDIGGVAGTYDVADAIMQALQSEPQDV